MPTRRVSTKKETQKVDEVEKLKQKLEDMTDKFNQLMKLVSHSDETSVQEDSKKAVKRDVFEDATEYIDILPNKRIKVVSLYDGVLTLTTGLGGSGKPYTFTKFGQSHSITWSDLSEILHYHHSFADKGYFYICDKNVIANENLTDTYNKILTKEMIDNLFEYSQKDMLELFKSTTDAQKEIIVGIITNKLSKNEPIDLNRVDAIERAYGKKFTDNILTEDVLKVS